ncbi:MAG: hypothetical protein ACLS7Z_05995 [Christensenellales bacterium]
MKNACALALALTPTCALGDSEGVIVQSSCNIVQSGDYYLAYCFAQVHNNASTVICLDQGTFDLQSGETLLSTSEVSQIWPYFLSPGEDGYLFDIVSFEPDENGNPVIPSITGISYNVTYLPVDNAYASYDLSAVSEIEQDVSGDVSVVCRLTNSTDMDAYNPTVALGLYTDNGAMLYSDGTTLGHWVFRRVARCWFVSTWTRPLSPSGRATARCRRRCTPTPRSGTTRIKER